MDTLLRIYEIYKRNPQISTDSRRISAGSVFFALHGENFDGNRYAVAALEAGAVAAVVDHPEVLPDTADDRYIRVPDTLTALQQLAAHHRHTLGLPILAITGSNGKTTTKELIGRTLSLKYRTAVTQGNLNNHIGVPLTLLSFTAETELGIVEMGASHCGEIALLCSIAQPDYGLITNIGKAHLEGFGGPEGVRRGKGELLDYLTGHGGTAFYLSDSEVLSAMATERPDLKTVPYSTQTLTPENGNEFLSLNWNGTPIRTHLVGDYNSNNVAAAIAVGCYFGVPHEKIKTAIESYIPDNNRSQKQATARNTLILDAYNANPSSMKAALENFAKEVSAQSKTVILGDMRELGEYSEAEHRAVIETVAAGGIPEVYLVGTCFSSLISPGGWVHKTNTDLRTFPDTEQLISYLSEHPLRDRFILIKGSRGIHLEKINSLL